MILDYAPTILDMKKLIRQFEDSANAKDWETASKHAKMLFAEAQFLHEYAKGEHEFTKN